MKGNVKSRKLFYSLIILQIINILGYKYFLVFTHTL